jgi:hypothetical protein
VKYKLKKKYTPTPNQTRMSDMLHLSNKNKKELIKVTTTTMKLYAKKKHNFEGAGLFTMDNIEQYLGGWWQLGAVFPSDVSARNLLALWYRFTLHTGK